MEEHKLEDPIGGEEMPGDVPSFYQMGPDKADNLHQQRPYFLLPLVTPRKANLNDYEKKVQGEQVKAMARIKSWIRRSSVQASELPEAAARQQKTKGHVSDVYVLSHGWHRNIFGAVAAYDRLSSRIALLIHRGRLPLPKPYHPIFINVHWHSDPGHNGWVDPSGRRHKPSFMQNVTTLFARADDAEAPPNGLSESGQYANDFEKMFEMFQTISAPGVHAFAETLFNKSKDLCTILDKRYDLMQAPDATLYDKVAALWTCYYEATPKRLLLEQTEDPAPFLSFKEVLATIWKFAVAAVGLTAILSFLPSASIFGDKNIFAFLSEVWTNALAAWTKRGWLPDNASGQWIAAGVVIAVLFAVSMAALYDFARRGKKSAPPTDGQLGAAAPAAQAKKNPAEMTLGVTILWFFATLVCAVPVLTGVLLTFLFGPFLARLRRRLPRFFWGLPREQSPTGGLNVMLPLSTLARWPTRVVVSGLPEGPRLAGPMDAVDSQLAFWEMQARGVQAGAEAARLLKELFKDLPELEGARVHLLGHSFGGLLVSNIAHAMTEETPIGKWDHSKPEQEQLTTLCTIQGALASNWFEENPAVVDTVSTTIAAVYSRYDTANMFYYPLANRSRKAQGYVGLSNVKGFLNSPLDRCEESCTGERDVNGEPLFDKKLNRQPKHVHRSCAFTTLADPPKIIRDHNKAVINVDGSRLIYEGAAASGGGHADIYKDDVVHLLWGIAHRTTVCDPDCKDPSHAVMERKDVHFIDCAIYISGDDGETFLSSVKHLLQAFHLPVETVDEAAPVRSSWFKRLTFRTKNVLTHAEVKRRLSEVEHALRNAGIEIPQAQINEKHAVAVSELLKATASNDTVAMFLGSILLVKVDGQVVVLTLSPQQMIALNNNPELLKSPGTLHVALAQLCTGQGKPEIASSDRLQIGFKSGEGSQC